jgi:hypothetical protein
MDSTPSATLSAASAAVTTTTVVDSPDSVVEVVADDVAVGAGGAGSLGVSMSPPKTVSAKAKVRSSAAHNLRGVFIRFSCKANTAATVAAGGLWNAVPT